jgi:phosphoesterase RecJ-like protein
MQRMLASLRLDAAGRLATMVLRQMDFAETGARADETEDLINEAMRIGSVELAILLVEQPTGPVRVSFRSRREVDVAELARRFGGGGHARAAGARIDGDGETVRRLLIDAAGEALARSASA